MQQVTRLIRVSDETYEQLKSLGEYGISMDTIIARLLANNRKKEVKRNAT
jgi:predicted CopG family antitoxin